MITGEKKRNTEQETSEHQSDEIYEVEPDVQITDLDLKEQKMVDSLSCEIENLRKSYNEDLKEYFSIISRGGTEAELKASKLIIKIKWKLLNQKLLDLQRLPPFGIHSKIGS